MFNVRRLSFALLALLPLALTGCDEDSNNHDVKAVSGVSQATVKVETDPSGLTVEQRNVRDRLLMDNKPGSIKHLYVISPLSGQVILYSTVKGKVTSSGKRLSPRSVATQGGEYVGGDFGGIPVTIGGMTRRTPEVLEDDGTYGSSVDYIYWWDAQGRYHQHFFTGGQIIHVSDQPIQTKGVIINLETNSVGTPEPEPALGVQPPAPDKVPATKPAKK